MTTTRPTQQSLIEDGQALVYSLATQIHRKIPVRIDLDDLIGYGELGLAEAARNFDADQGSQFTTFAYYRIRGAIYDGLSKMAWTSRARYRRLRYQQMANEVLSADAESGDTGEGNLENDANWFCNVTNKLAVVYINSQGQDESGWQDISVTDSRADAPSVIIQRELSQKLRELVDALPSLQSGLISFIYFEGLTLEEAGSRLGISKSWASRLHAKTLEELARSLRKIGAGD